MEGSYCVYMHESPNCKKYIGITRQKPERRWQNGFGYVNNKYFYRAIEKYGWENFKHIIIKDNLSKENAEKLEIELIKKYESNNPNNGYNILDGGKCSGFYLKFSKEFDIGCFKNFEKCKFPDDYRMFFIDLYKKLELQTNIPAIRYFDLKEYSLMIIQRAFSYYWEAKEENRNWRIMNFILSEFCYILKHIRKSIKNSKEFCVCKNCLMRKEVQGSNDGKITLLEYCDGCKINILEFKTHKVEYFEEFKDAISEQERQRIVDLFLLDLFYNGFGSESIQNIIFRNKYEEELNISHNNKVEFVEKCVYKMFKNFKNEEEYQIKIEKKGLKSSNQILSNASTSQIDFHNKIIDYIRRTIYFELSKRCNRLKKIGFSVCKECGDLYLKNPSGKNTSEKYCNGCKKNVNKKQIKLRVRKYRKCNESKTIESE